MRFVLALLIGLILGSAVLIADVGAAAQHKEPALQENFYGVHISGQRAWIVGYYGTILHSADRGQTWVIQPSSTRRALYSVKFVGPSTGWISGSSGTVLHTQDSGRSWRARAAGSSEHLFASDWHDELKGWIVGSRGTTLRTADGGRSWTTFQVPGDFTFNTVKFTSASSGWIAGEFGVIFRTLDAGKRWEKQPSPIEVSFASGASQNLFALLFPSPSLGYAFGLDGVVLKTGNGNGWKIARRPENTNGASHHLFAAAAFDGRIAAVGERGTLLQSDPIDQWRRADLQIPRLSLNAVAFGPDGFGLIVGNRGLVLRTENGGKTWRRVKIDLEPSGKDQPAP